MSRICRTHTSRSMRRKKSFRKKRRSSRNSQRVEMRRVPVSDPGPPREAAAAQHRSPPVGPKDSQCRIHLCTRSTPVEPYPLQNAACRPISHPRKLHPRPRGRAHSRSHTPARRPPPTCGTKNPTGIPHLQCLGARRGIVLTGTLISTALTAVLEGHNARLFPRFLDHRLSRRMVRPRRGCGPRAVQTSIITSPIYAAMQCKRSTMSPSHLFRLTWRT